MGEDIASDEEYFGDEEYHVRAQTFCVTYAYGYWAGRPEHAINSCSLRISGELLLGLGKTKDAVLEIIQPASDFDPRKGLGDINDVPHQIRFSFVLPLASIISITPLLSMRRENEFLIHGTALEKQAGLSDTAVGYHKTAWISRVSFESSEAVD